MFFAAAQQPYEIWPLIVYAALVVLITGGMLAISYLVGQKHNETQTDPIYESGVKTTGDARISFPVHFYIPAMFLVIFDIEPAFIISLAAEYKDSGWGGAVSIELTRTDKISGYQFKLILI